MVMMLLISNRDDSDDAVDHDGGKDSDDCSSNGDNCVNKL